jgi:hypothetical protein
VSTYCIDILEFMCLVIVLFSWLCLISSPSALCYGFISLVIDIKCFYKYAVFTYSELGFVEVFTVDSIS